MIPLAPPVGYWKQLDACVSGLSFPNFRLYAQAFSLRPLSVWFDPDASVSWRAIEESIVYSYKLKHLVFSGVPLCSVNLGLVPL